MALLGGLLGRLLWLSGLRRGRHAPGTQAMDQDRALEVYGDYPRRRRARARSAWGGEGAGSRVALRGRGNAPASPQDRRAGGNTVICGGIR